MSQQPKYAIRCSTEEQARECYELKLAVVDDTIDAQKESTFEAFGYTIITYEEAKEMGLLGEKISCPILSETLIEPQQNKVQESPSDDIVDKIIQDWIGTHGENRAIYWREAEKLLNKHLLSK